MGGTDRWHRDRASWSVEICEAARERYIQVIGTYEVAFWNALGGRAWDYWPPECGQRPERVPVDRNIVATWSIPSDLARKPVTSQVATSVQSLAHWAPMVSSERPRWRLRAGQRSFECSPVRRHSAELCPGGLFLF
jgi:hypothetical protein